MNDKLRRRRNETWDLLVVKGLKHGEVAEKLAPKYDVTESTIRTDISRMDDWLPELDASGSESGVSRVRETRQNRQRLHRMALQAKDENDRDQELAIRREIDRAIERDISLTQSLGMTPEEPNKHEVSGNGEGGALKVDVLREEYDGGEGDDSDSDENSDDEGSE